MFNIRYIFKQKLLISNIPMLAITNLVLKITKIFLDFVKHFFA